MMTKIESYSEHFRDQIIDLWERSVRATHRFLTSQEVDRLKLLVKQIDFNSFSVYCLVSGSKVIGFVGVEGIVIESLFLDPDYIGQKLGSRLMNFAIHQLKAQEVTVNEQNEMAIRFYESFGFETYERLECDEYGNNYPVLKMKRAMID